MNRRTCTTQAKVKDPDDSSIHLCIACAGKAGLVAVSSTGVSVEASQCFDAIELQLGMRIENSVRIARDGTRSGSEKYGLLPDNRLVHPDGFTPNYPDGCKGTVFEYHGDYYHGYPPWHDAHESHVFRGRWGPDLYRDTMMRMQLFKDQGYRVLYIWGSDWKRTNARHPDLTLAETLREL